MAQWGNTDDAANSVLWGVSQLNKTANSVNQVLLYGNTTPDGFITNRIDGQFALDVTEISISGNAAIQQYVVVTGGTGYSSNASVTVANTTGGGDTTYANSTVAAGRVTALTANVTVGGYTSIPSVTIAAPTSINIVSNTSGFSNTTDVFKVSTANTLFRTGDRLYYGVPSGNTPLAPLSGNTYYYVAFSNTTSIKLATVPGGANIDITDARNDTSPETHTITGDTATAVAVLTERGYTKGAAHTGWVLRTVGEGGRAGRVQYEVLVAMGGNFSTDGSDDAILPDA